MFTFDSRAIQPGDVFVALKGEKADGHDFIPMARERGAARIIDGLAALQTEAREKRRALAARGTTVVGVTGSAGKTTTKELLKTFLACAGQTSGTEGNFNNHIGLPLTILNAPDDLDFLVLEMGSNHPGEIAALCDIAEPDVGVVTGVGTAHLEFFKTRAGIAEEKGTLVARAKDVAVFPANDDFASVLQARSSRARGIDLSSAACLLDTDRAYPPHFESNVALAFAVAAHFGVTAAAAQAALQNFALPGARWRQVEKGGIHFIDDTYNANPNSMIAALDRLAEMPAPSRRVAILGDMFELGDEALTYHQQVFDHARSLPLACVIGVGSLSSQCAAHHIFKNLEDLRAALPSLLKKDDTVLLKASHGMNLGVLLVEAQSVV